MINKLTQEVFAELVQLLNALVASQHLSILTNLLKPPEHANLKLKNLTKLIHYLNLQFDLKILDLNLEEKSGQFAIESDAVEHLDDAMVGEVGVLSVALKQLREGGAHASGGKSLHEALKVKGLKSV